ncbi:STAS domain-containing protein [Streptomyces gibsoniae]|uniref:STAS domain-containing protein n=1 Tax=Streptomyces gibsoniae TaxID=3075529 RepID=A0ABU2TTC3_9ACTN|nr:STAS domain-containing protein [Streptomyces sp. DSM 41699]MDT0464140.1 STAS domain-containing protein [Streptomyces sp. DSM 41699]
MTTSHTPSLTLTVETERTAIVVRVAGDLDYESCDELVSTVDGQLARWPRGGPGLTALHLDFAGLGAVDSMGLSALLTIRRRTDAAAIDLRLDERPPALQRLLEITGSLEHLTAPFEDSHAGEQPGAG